ncbi:MAG: thiamine pyrophosphate-binding protein [Zhengella sp.]|uniref:thiamine pyrophosphate-binding protein n=1 Tax=Zhengella sp. TaxID=2282762 RepID=UPI00352771A3
MLMKTDAPTRTETVGEAIARHLADIGVTRVFGVISIHNMPILDAIARQGRIRFVPARGEAGAMNMADAYARVSRSLGVVITSTGTGAGNTAGAQVEALTAGSPVLHITTQVDRQFMDRDRAAIHDVPRQTDMLKGISKTCLRMWEARSVHTVLSAAASAALSPPSGPVSLEIPVDVQRETVPEQDFIARPLVVRPLAGQDSIAALAELVKKARRPMLWLGGGARHAGDAANALVERGFCAVSSTNGRAVVDEASPYTLGAFNMTPEAEAIYAQCDLMIVAGSRLRGNETRNNTLPLPSPLVQIDAEATQGARNYPVDLFIHGDAKDSLARLLDLLPERLETDAEFRHSIAIARVKAEGRLRDQLGVYRVIADALQERVAAGGHPFVRDVTISNSTFGNRYVQFAAPHHGVHALGGGIGQGLAMGIGAGLVEGEAKSIVLVGDGGAQLGIAELITAVEEKANLVYVLMNDQAYGVIKNIQDAQYGSRHHYSALRTPDFALMCQAVGLAHVKVSHETAFAGALDEALAADGPVLIEVDMCAIGPFAQAFAGPPAGAAGKGN